MTDNNTKATPRTDLLFPEGVPTGAVVIFGATGGIGPAICSTFAAAGCRLAITYHKGQERAEALAADLKAAGAEVTALKVDVTDPASVESCLEAAAETFGGIASIIYASGPKVTIRPIADIDPELWASAINTDVNGFFHIVRAAIPYLRRSRGPIVALCTAGTARYPSLDILSAGPKASVQMLVRGIAREEGRNGIRANSIGVGTIQAGQSMELMSDPRFERVVDRVINATPLKRLGEASEIASVALFLASPMASYVNGQHVNVDGGGSV